MRLSLCVKVVIKNCPQVILDLGRRPEARFLGHRGAEILRDFEVSASAGSDGLHALRGLRDHRRKTMWCIQFLRCLQVERRDLDAAELTIGDFGGDNRAGVPGTLHRISAIRNRKGLVVGLTCRVGRAITGHIDMIRDILGGVFFAVQSVPVFNVTIPLFL